MFYLIPRILFKFNFPKMTTFSLPLALFPLVFIFFILSQDAQGIVPPGICEDGTPACQIYQSEMCPKNGRLDSSFETYAYCCCRKTCGLCDRESVEQRVEGRFEKYEDRSSYDWSGQRWRFGDEWEGMDEFKGDWGNPFRRGGRGKSRGGNWENSASGEMESGEEFY